MKFLKGLYKDSALVDQPQSTHRDALNMIMNLDKGSISTEYGNTVANSSVRISNSIPVGEDRKPNGSILLPDNKFLLFYSTLYTDTNTSTSYIYLFDPEGDLMTLVFATSNNSNDPYYSLDTGHLNFSPDYPITGEARVAANGDIIVYFTDNYKDVKIEPITKIEYINKYNPPRTFNITRQLQNIRNGASPSNLYVKIAGTKGAFTGKNVDYLNLFLVTSKIPQVIDHRLLKGGILETGAYYLCLAYATEDFTETNIYTVSQPVYIPIGNYIDTGNSGSGVTPAVPFEHMTGAPANTQTSFSIQWKFATREYADPDGNTSHYDKNYPYIVPYIIKLSGTARSAYKLPLVPLSEEGVVTFTGNENYAVSSVEDIVLDKATYLTAKTMTQLDNKLYLGNLTARKDIGFQRFTSNIVTTPVIKKFKRFDNRVFDNLNLNYGYTQILKKYEGTYNQDFDDYKLVNTYYNKYQISSIYDGDTTFWIDTNTAENTPNRMGGYRNQYIASYLKSYRRGEVYALYISFVLNDGTETYAYHIPGRNYTALTVYHSSGLSADLIEEGWDYTATTAKNSYINETNDTGLSKVGVTNKDLFDKLGFYKYNKVYDTSREIASERLDDSAEHSMGFWRNETESYPETNDFKIFDVDTFGNPVDTGNALTAGVRHHKFPSNLNDSYSYIDKNRINLYRVIIPGSGTPTGYVEQSFLTNLRTATASWDDQVNQSAFFYETINILGFKLSNIKIPKFILGQIQGFKVYYAKRTLENKTILGQSLVHPSFFRAHGFFSTTRTALSNKVTGPFYRYWSFYANIPDVLTAPADSYIKYSSYFYGIGYYNAGTGSLLESSTYLGSPIVKFHDFTMLRKKINLNIVDYISIQSVVTMHQYNGMLRNATLSDTVRESSAPTYNVDYLAGYKYFQTGLNENEEFSWIHADFGNLDSKIARVTITGVLDSFAPHRGPHKFKANVMIGAQYTAYREDSFANIENSTDVFTNQFTARALGNVFAITNNGASYINGLSYLKVPNVDSFHGAQYLDNYGGETAIALSLKSGLPRLLGHVTDSATYDSNHYDTESDSGSILRALNPDENPDSLYETLGRGKANMFLANLHSYKTDVFNPFDNQTLVWTGYYHPCQITQSSLDTGEVGGVLNCLQFLSYEQTTFPTDITTDTGSPVVRITYDLNSPQDDDLTFTALDTAGQTFVAGETYNYTFILADPGMLASDDSNDPYAEISIGGGTPVVITFDGVETTYTGTVVCGSSNTNLIFNLGTNTTYKSSIDISVSQGNPECIDTYYPEYLQTAFQNTDDYDNMLAAYNTSSNYYTGLETGWIFGGDTFIARYNYRTTSMDFPNYYIEQNVTADPDTPTVWDSIGAGNGQQMSLPEVIDANLSPISSIIPYNDYMGTVAFMNTRVLRTYGGADEWPNITETGPNFNLLDHFLSLQVASPITSGNPDGMYRLANFNEQAAVIANATLYSVFVESDDNLNFRHAGDVVKGVGKDASLFFDGYTAADVLFRSPLLDLTKQDNLLYEDHYSALQDIKTTVPFPKKGEIETSFPSRVIRSNVQDGRIDDNYRNFLALQYKDFSQNKGAVTNLAALTGLLFIHTEKSLYKTTGKQTIQLGDTTEAYIGSGDIFVQEPLELVTSNEGYAGTFNKHSCLINKYGYLFVSRKEKKVFLLTDKLIEISQQGMENWFRLNIPYTLETTSSNNPYPINLDTIPYINLDAPTGSFGFVSTYDPIFKRFIITKKELIPSSNLNQLLTEYLTTPLNNTFDPGSCFGSLYGQPTDVVNPIGTAVGNINGSTVLINSYFAPSTNPNIWYDPTFGTYIINQPLLDELETLGITGAAEHLTELTLTTYGETSEDCVTDTFYAISIANDNYWFVENGWTISYYPDNQSWISRHSYVSPWYFYNSESFFSFESRANSSTPNTFKIWRHNSTNGVQFYETNYNYEFEFVVNDSPDLTKIISAVSLNADVYTKDETGIQVSADSTTYLKDRLNSYNIQLPFNSFYIYNTYQNSGEITFDYLNNIRRIEGSWIFNNFRDIVKYAKSGSLSNNEYNVSGGFNNNVQTPFNTLMFLDEGVINPNILNTTKPWYEQKKFMDKFFAVRLIGQGNNNLVNLYSANATLRKSSR